MRLKAFPRVPKVPVLPDLSPPKLTGLEDIQKAMENQANALERHFARLQAWQDNLIDNIAQRETNLDRSINGGIEFARPFSTEQNPGANIAMGFRHFLFDNSASSSAAICVDPRYGDGKTPPRGWFVVQVQEVGAVQTSRPILVLDQILSSTNPSPFPTILGYPFAQVDAADSRIIKGENAALPNGWVGSDVRAGDQISLVKTYTGGGTITTTLGSEAITGVGTTFKSLHIFDYIRLTGSPGFNEWKQISGIQSDTALTVVDPFRVAIAGAAYELKVADDGWLGIVAVTLGVLTEDTLTLDPKGLGTEVPLGSTQVQYVIRRPPKTKKLWVRVLSDNPNPVAVTLGIF